MADSILEQIAQRAVADLGAVGKPADLQVHRSRARPIDQDELPAAVVYLLTEVAQRKGGEWGPLLECDAMLAVELRVAGNPPDQVLDPHRTWAIAQLESDQTMGGLATSVSYVGAEWQAAASNKVLGAVRLTFHVKYLMRAVDPEAQ